MCIRDSHNIYSILSHVLTCRGAHWAPVPLYCFVSLPFFLLLPHFIALSLPFFLLYLILFPSFLPLISYNSPIHFLCGLSTYTNPNRFNFSSTSIYIACAQPRPMIQAGSKVSLLTCSGMKPCSDAVLVT